MSIASGEFGITAAGERIDRFTVANDAGLELQAITYGGIITALRVPDHAGTSADVVLGYTTLAEYERQTAYFGAIVGRYANRIAHGRFALDGVTHQLATNEGAHHLHGGDRGFDKRVWRADPFETSERRGIRFSRVSEAGEEKYPGTLDVAVSYALATGSELIIEYEATTTAATIVNLTQHTYFDLSAGTAADVMDHVLHIRAREYLPVDEDSIPLGTLESVGGTPFDFSKPRRIGERIDSEDEQLRHGRGYDHTWVLETEGDVSQVAAMVHDAHSGRTLAIRTTEPGLQFYSGNRLSGEHGKDGRRYAKRSGLCLETQHYPNSPAHPHFPSTVLRPGETYRSQTVWTFGVEARS